MFAWIYRDFAGKSECWDFKFTGIACIPAIHVIFEVNQKKVWTFYIYSLLRFFKFPYNFCGDFRRTCNPRDNDMHFTGYVLRHGDPPYFLWGENLQCTHFQNNIFATLLQQSNPETNQPRELSFLGSIFNLHGSLGSVVGKVKFDLPSLLPTHKIVFGHSSTVGLSLGLGIFRKDTVKSRVLTRLIQKHMPAFSDCL